MVSMPVFCFGMARKAELGGSGRLRNVLVNEIDDLLRGRAGEENPCDADSFQFGHVGCGNDAAKQHDDVGHAVFVQEFHQLRTDCIVRSG
jgi:hypothetical protein